MDQGLYDGAYYLSGYAVEWALKACIAKNVKRYDFPDRKMDRAILVGPDIKEGKKLLEKLDQTDLQITEAFWYYRSGPEVYRLMVVTPFFEKYGLRKTYEKIQKALRNNSDINLSLNEISVIGPNDPLSKLLTNNKYDMSGKRLTGSVVNGVYVDDVYFYRTG